jgi:hypothetical protein
MFGFGKVSNKFDDNRQPEGESKFYADVFSRFVKPVSIGPDSVVPKTTEAGMLIAGALGLCQFFGSHE